MKDYLKNAFQTCAARINDMATMAVCFAIGNIPIYWQAFVLENPTLLSKAGFGATSMAALLVTGSRLYEMHKNIPKEKSSIPHFTLSAFNFAAAGASLLSMINGYVDPDLITVGMAVAFTGWGTANLMRGIEKRKNRELESFIRPAILWPISDMAATINTAGWPFGLVSLTKSHFFDPPNARNIAVRTPTDFIIKHISWDRILLVSYAVAATTSHPLISSGFLLFCAGYYQNGEFDINKNFVRDFKRAKCSAQLSLRKLSL